MDELNADIKAWVEKVTSGTRIVEVEGVKEEEELILKVQAYIRSAQSSGKEPIERGSCPWVLSTLPPPVMAPPSSFDDFYEVRNLPPDVLDKSDPARLALLSDSLSTPLTLSHILESRKTVGKDELVVHLINPQMKDLDVSKYLELLYLTPGVSSLKVVLVGPEVPEDMDGYSYVLDGTSGEEEEKELLLKPIVEIGMVFEGSPAATAGLQRGDLVTRIGDTIDSSTFIDVGTSIVPYIGANINKPIGLTVYRLVDDAPSDGEDGADDEQTLEELVVEITPSVWEGGKGVLGCTFVNPSYDADNLLVSTTIRTVTVTCFRRDYADYRKSSVGDSPHLVGALDSGICYSSAQWMEALSIMAQDSQVPFLSTSPFAMEAELDRRILEMCAFDVIVSKANPFKSPLPSPHPLGVPLPPKSYCYSNAYLMVALPKATEGKYGDNPDLDKLVDYVTGKVGKVSVGTGEETSDEDREEGGGKEKKKIPSILSKARTQMRMRHKDKDKDKDNK